MSFFDYLDDLRGRSIEQRRRVALYWAIFITIAILSFWLLNLSIIKAIDNPGRETRLAREIRRIKIGFNAIKDSVLTSKK